jgi:hypothetical protein
MVKGQLAFGALLLATGQWISALLIAALACVLSFSTSNDDDEDE